MHLTQWASRCQLAPLKLSLFVRQTFDRITDARVFCAQNYVKGL